MLVVTEFVAALTERWEPEISEEGRRAMETKNQMIGADGTYTGGNSALRAFLPSVRLRARHLGVIADLSPDSVPWRPPVS
jgi:hypothetical protein